MDARCVVCDHVDREEIDRGLRSGGAAPRLAEKYGVRIQVLREHQLRHLDNPQLRQLEVEPVRRDRDLLIAAERRREAEWKLAGRREPPPGWLFCPECDSPNVRSKGDGDWREDPGPIHWHVTRCLDCGWPDGQPG